MKFIITLAVVALLGGDVAAKHHHGIKKALKHKGQTLESSLIQMNIDSN
jgi:hypothetical protein